ncbi:MAG: hypothetical protein BWY65_00370 [Firmicutes bacterium ADurb.Bin373]|nr:MAG: hypothetical protein BWY65_00370 [Firmicutes bacterium ADurb.Bin373]
MTKKQGFEIVISDWCGVINVNDRRQVKRAGDLLYNTMLNLQPRAKKLKETLIEEYICLMTATAKAFIERHAAILRSRDITTANKLVNERTHSLGGKDYYFETDMD